MTRKERRLGMGPPIYFKEPKTKTKKEEKDMTKKNPSTELADDVTGALEDVKIPDLVPPPAPPAAVEPQPTFWRSATWKWGRAVTGVAAGGAAVYMIVRKLTK